MLELVLKTSNCAGLVLLKSNTMPNDGGQDHMFRFIPLKKVDRPAKFGKVATPKVLDDMNSKAVARGAAGAARAAPLFQLFFFF